MAAHLENHPGMRCVVNFAPILLEQLADYSQQLGDFINLGQPMRDPLLNLLASCSPIPSREQERDQLIKNCLRANAKRMIDPFPNFVALREIYTLMPQVARHPTRTVPAVAALEYLDEQYFYDILVWYHLVWMGRSLRNHPTLTALFAKGHHYNAEDRQALIVLIQEATAGIIPRYRQLADQGQVELSMTPYGHPIVPLLMDMTQMSAAQPNDPLPEQSSYPGGEQSVRWHMQHGMEVFEHFFGRRPVGVWLSEGGISAGAVALLDELEIKWTASGEAVWRNSCGASGGCVQNRAHEARPLFSPYTLKGSDTRLFFRDDGLSDLIGFEYSSWHADDAVSDFIHHLTNIADAHGEHADQHVISVILDGENAWEYYPQNGHHFLDQLYLKLCEHPRIQVSTFAGLPQQVTPLPLDTLIPGSWVYGSFSTWIGSTDKNRGWVLLVEAKRAFDQVMATHTLDSQQQARARRQLAVCEGSDWFWWFGDYNPSDSVNDFDILFRQQLSELYTLLALPIPPTLEQPISAGGGSMENAGTMRRN